MKNIYPQQEEVPGAPFEDPHLKLAVLGSLLRDKYIDLGTPQEFASWVYGLGGFYFIRCNPSI